MRHLPPLKSLKAFDAVTRCGSFTRASEELCVTHGAVSKQVKILEEWMGLPLLKREGHSLKPTYEGQRLNEVLVDALNDIESAIREIKKTRFDQKLIINTTHSIASKWLLPLYNNSENKPDVEIWLETAGVVENLANSKADLAIRLGKGNWNDGDCIPLKKDRVIVVASKLLAPEGKYSLKDLVEKYPLLHDQDPNIQWASFAKEKGIKSSKLTKGTRYSSSDLLISASVEGKGLALVNAFLVDRELQEGKLFSPIKDSKDLSDYIWIVKPKMARSINTDIFINWLKQCQNN